jgi:hypothetical protein
VLIFYASAEYMLRLTRAGIIILSGDNETLRNVGPKHRARNAQPPLSRDHQEETMITRLAAITLAVLFAAISLTGGAEAGASASAPSKYGRSSQVAASQQAAKHDFAITEYSSSSARNRGRCSATAYC